MIGNIADANGKHIGFGHRDDFAEQIAAGATLIVSAPDAGNQVWEANVWRDKTQAELDAEALVAAKTNKNAELKRAFIEGAERPVAVDGVGVFAGGMTSGLMVDGLARWNRGKGKGAQDKLRVRPHGSYGRIELTVEQAEAVSYAITAQADGDDELFYGLLGQIEAAPTVEVVEAIAVPTEWELPE